MLAGHEGNRHSGLGGLRHRRQLLPQRISTPALHSREHFNSINSIRHRRITRLTPSPSLCSYGPVEMGAAPVTIRMCQYDMRYYLAWKVTLDMLDQFITTFQGAAVDDHQFVGARFPIPNDNRVTRLRAGSNW